MDADWVNTPLSDVFTVERAPITWIFVKKNSRSSTGEANPVNCFDSAKTFDYNIFDRSLRSSAMNFNTEVTSIVTTMLSLLFGSVDHQGFSVKADVVAMLLQVRLEACVFRLQLPGHVRNQKP